MPRRAAIGVNDDLAAGEPRVAVRPAGDEPPGGVHQDPRLAVHEAGRDDGRDDALPNVLLDLRVGRLFPMLRADDDGVYALRLAVGVFDRHLRLAVGLEVGDAAVAAGLGEAAREFVRERDGQGHQFVGLAAGEADHHPLVARPGVGVVERAVPAVFERGVHRRLDVGRLLVHVLNDFAGGVVNADGVVVVADAFHRFADDRLVVHLGGGGDLAEDVDEAGACGGFAGDAGLRVLLVDRVQDRVGHLVAEFVGVPLGDRLGGQQVSRGGLKRRSVLRHSRGSLLVCSCAKVRSARPRRRVQD